MRHNLVLGLTSDGLPHQWLHWETAVTAKAKNLISFELGDPDMIMGGTSRMTGERTSMTIGTIIGIKGKFKHQAAKTPVLSNSSLFKRDLLICGYCGHHFSESHLTRDHIIPVSKGGKDSWMNCISSCKKCNGKKGNMFLEDVGMELLWVPYIPNRYEALILANRNILADQAEYVAGFIPKHSRVPKYLEQHCGIIL